MNLISYNDKLAGTTFEGRQDVIALVEKDTPLRFRREPENEHDANAVAVDAQIDGDWKSVGYIRAKYNKDLAKLLVEGKEASISVASVTGGGDKNWGLNCLIQHEPIKKTEKKYKGVLEKDLFGNEIYYDDASHTYSNSLGEVYLSGSKYADKFFPEFPKDIISQKMAKKIDSKNYGSIAQEIKDMWDLNALASTSLGTAIHAAIELYGRYSGLSEALEKDSNLHKNPLLRAAVESFYKKYPLNKNLHFEALVVDHKTARAGRIDRLQVESDGVWIEDIKTNFEITDKDIKKYGKQLNFYAAICRANKLKVKGLRLFHYDGKNWHTVELEQEDIDNTFKLLPEVLSHPHIPKPLHEVNPRNIMGKEAWDITRQKAYHSTNYHCVACGVHKTKARKHKWLEAHEFYKFDYENGRVEIEKIIPLCHFCHNFIHSGRLSMIMGKDKTKTEVKNILKHGIAVLSKNNLKAFPFTLKFAQSLGVDTAGVEAYDMPDSSVEWGDWRMIWEGKEYPPKYKTYEEWAERWSE